LGLEIIPPVETKGLTTNYLLASVEHILAVGLYIHNNRLINLKVKIHANR